MTNEITIFPSGNDGDDFMPAPIHQAPAPPPPQTPIQRMHRILRGRYLLAIILCGAGAIAGAIFGWTSKQPLYQSDGFVMVNPYTGNITAQEVVMPMYMLYVQGQVQILQSERIIAAAMGSDEWLSVARGSPSNLPMVFKSNLDVAHVRNTALIRVSYLDSDPKIANAAVQSVLKAYSVTYDEVDSRNRMDKDKIRMLQARKTERLTEREAKQRLIDSLARKYGTDELGPLHEEKLRRNSFQETLLYQEEAALNLARERQNAASGQVERSLETLIEEIAQTDAKMRDMLAQREDRENNIARLRYLYGDKSSHRSIDRAQFELDVVNKRIEDYAKSYPERFMNIAGNPAISPSPDMIQAMVDKLKTPQDIESFAAAVEARKKRYEADRVQTIEMGIVKVQIQNYKTEIAQYTENLRDIDRQIDTINAQIELTKRIEITYPREAPRDPSVDKRKQFAAMGFVAGGALPLGLLVLIGLMDRRYRYSDDATTDLSHLPMLGVLPNLPDRLSDPKQAAIASHCVHQIRAMLQIDGTGNTRHVWAISSAAAGDGKTSLTLSLGLSYAACGARTLLVDCDLVGAGLSSRLNIRSPHGVLDAIATRSLLQYVHSTDAADVAILPAGAATPQQASALSPAALRRLIIEAKRHFEVILIDTGPVLGSIEASLVATAVDGVILTVARGQQSSLVEKAVQHLNSIGARIAGIVFNRANARDFESTVSGQSKRLEGRPTNGNGGNGHTQPAPFGPVARAVASSSFKEEK